MTIAKGIAKQLVIAEQTGLGVIAAVDAASAAYMRRVTSDISLKKETYQSNEIRTDQQVADFRHGVRSVDGTISGELSPGAYEMLMESVMRKDWAAAAVGGSESDIAAAVVAGAEATFTSAATATFMTDGLKIGDVGRWTGWTTTGDGNNDRNFLITDLTELVMTGVFLDGSPAAAKIAGDAVTFTGVGKKTLVPLTAHTNTYFTIEHYYSDLDISEVFTDCKFGSMAIKLPPTGMATIDFGVIGLDMTAKGTAAAPYFTGPIALGEEGVLAAVNGALYVQGVAVALLTGLDITVDAGLTPADAVVGSNVKPDVFDGRVRVSGNMTVYFEDETFRDYFDNETEVSVVGAFTTSNDGDADFLAFCMPRVKVGGSSKDDGEKGLVQTMPFTALLNVDGGAALDTDETTISIQDSSI